MVLSREDRFEPESQGIGQVGLAHSRAEPPLKILLPEADPWYTCADYTETQEVNLLGAFSRDTLQMRPSQREVVGTYVISTTTIT